MTQMRSTSNPVYVKRQRDSGRSPHFLPRVDTPIVATKNGVEIFENDIGPVLD